MFALAELYRRPGRDFAEFWHPQAGPPLCSVIVCFSAARARACVRACVRVRVLVPKRHKRTTLARARLRAPRARPPCCSRAVCDGELSPLGYENYPRIPSVWPSGFVHMWDGPHIFGIRGGGGGGGLALGGHGDGRCVVAAAAATLLELPCPYTPE